MTTVLPAPIACTLGAGGYADRLAWTAQLERSSLRAHRQDGLALVLDYAPAAESRVRDLVAHEQACCAFLAFRLEETPRTVRLTVTAPAEAGEALDAVFAPFLTGAQEVLPDQVRDEDQGSRPERGRPEGGRTPGARRER